EPRRESSSSGSVTFSLERAGSDHHGRFRLVRTLHFSEPSQVVWRLYAMQRPQRRATEQRSIDQQLVEHELLLAIAEGQSIPQNQPEEKPPLEPGNWAERMLRHWQQYGIVRSHREPHLME